MDKIPFGNIDWANVEKIENQGLSGRSFSQTIHFAKFSIRVVEYSENYISDHWCSKGHVVYCLGGEFDIEFENKKTERLSKGMSFIVSDNQCTHRSKSLYGAKLLIIDGSFLK